jgi:hypothetical protein
LENCHYICNHGLEIVGPELNFHHSSAERLRGTSMRRPTPQDPVVRRNVLVEDRLTAA